MSALDSELAALPTLSAHQLRLKWRDLRCGEPTAASSRDLMIREIAYKMQERTHGGLAPAIKRRLRALAAEVEANGAGAFAPALLLKPGTRRDLLSNQLVLIAPADATETLKIKMHFDLAGATGDGKIAVCTIDSCPGGIYAKQALQALCGFKRRWVLAVGQFPNEPDKCPIRSQALISGDRKVQRYRAVS